MLEALEITINYNLTVYVHICMLFIYILQSCSTSYENQDASRKIAEPIYGILAKTI